MIELSTDNIHCASLQPPLVITDPGSVYDVTQRKWQGIPGIAITPAGRLIATWYTGGTGEGCSNHVVLVMSRDRGETWSRPVLVVDAPDKVRAFDPVVWTDPQGRLWLFWSQSFGWWNGRGGVWAICCDEPDAPRLAWSAPHRIANGVMMNKPTVLANGHWLLPAAVWKVSPSMVARLDCQPAVLPELQDEARSNVIISTDKGKMFRLRGGADVPMRSFDEHMIVERRDSSLWMLVRTHYGIGQSISTDGGATWSPGTPTAIASPCSRFFIRRLASGRLLLINHRNFTGRSHLTASLSEDDGISWQYHLLLDERTDVSYPDADIAPDGLIHIIYDRDRNKEREVLLTAITEADILAERVQGADSYVKRIVSKVPPEAGSSPHRS